MFNYLFPIFAFGCVITGIVFLGLQQASDWAKKLAEEQRDAENRSKLPADRSPEVHSSPSRVPTTARRL